MFPRGVASLSGTGRVFWKKPGRTLGRAVSCVFSFKNTWGCEFDLRVLPALFPYLPSAAVNQVSGRGRVSRVLPLLRTGRRARLPAGRLHKLYTSSPRGLDNKSDIYFL